MYRQSEMLGQYKIYLIKKVQQWRKKNNNIDVESGLLEAIEKYTPEDVLYNANSDVFKYLINNDDFNKHNIELLQKAFLDKASIYKKTTENIKALELINRK